MSTIYESLTLIATIKSHNTKRLLKKVYIFDEFFQSVTYYEEEAEHVKGHF